MRLFFFSIVVFFAACSNNNASKNILKPEKMQAVLWDYFRADAYANEILRQDTSLNLNLESAKLQQKVFNQHGVSKEQFYKSYQYYMEHKDKFKDILDTMIVRQQRPVNSPTYQPENKAVKKKNLSEKKP